MEKSSLFLISDSDQLDNEEKISLQAGGYRTNFEDIPGKVFYFLNKIPGEKKEILRLYQLSVYNQLKSYYNFLLNGKFKEAMDVLIARIHYSQLCFRSQDMCQSNTLIKQGAGYSIEDFMDAVSASYYELLKYVVRPYPYDYYCYRPRQVVKFDENEINKLKRFIL